MAADYISREAAIKAIRSECVGCVGQEIGERFCSKCAIRRREVALYSIPAADVRPVDEISDAVDEVLDFLNENSNCMPYHIYSALFDLVSGIYLNCGADMREEAGDE